jgi:hypothetical protein
MGTYRIDANNPNGVALRRAILAISLTAGACLAVTGSVSGDLTSALFLVGFGLAMGAEGWWSFGRDRKGQIDVTPDGIIEKSKSQTTLVPWVHVKAARMRDLNEENATTKWILRLFVRDLECRYVEIQLDRWIYKNLWRARFGTAEHGLPTFRSARRFFTPEPDALLAEIQQRILSGGTESALDIDHVT